MCPLSILCLFKYDPNMLWGYWYAQPAMACVDACSQKMSSPFKESYEICIGSASQKHEAQSDHWLHDLW